MNEDTKAPRRGWSSRGLPLVGTTDPAYWSVYDASIMLGPPKLSEKQVRDMINLAGLRPPGKRRNGSRRRHVRVYLAVDLIDAFENIAKLMGSAG